MKGRHLPTALKLGAAILVLHGLVALLGPFVAPYAQERMMAGPPIQGISFAHPFGTDQMLSLIHISEPTRPY